MNPLTLNNAKNLTNKEAKELQIADEIQNAIKLDQNETESTEIKDTNQHESTEYDGLPEHRTLLIFVSLYIFIIRFRFHKNKNVLFTIIIRFNNIACSIIRKICSSLSAK